MCATATVTNGAPLSYQWYYCFDTEKTDAVAIEGATGNVFTVPTEDYGDFYYFCRISAEDAKIADTNVACVDVPVMKYKDGLAQPILTYTDATKATYTNEDSDIVRFCVYVETDYDTDGDNKLYLGVGNNFTAEDTTRPESVTATEETYAYGS